MHIKIVYVKGNFTSAKISLSDFLKLPNIDINIGFKSPVLGSLY